MRITKIALLLVAVMAPINVADAYNNPPLDWKTLKTPHFEVHYHEGAEWTAQAVARVAEEIYAPITELYGYEPETVHFVIRDTNDYANGAAYFFDNKIEIWATNLEFGFRGTSEWIRNVVTHEYTHMVSIQAALKMPRRIPAIYFQWIAFEQEKRSDVAQGYPTNILSYPYSGVVMPPWFAEGVAQYQSPSKRYDCWDTHRDMILRSGVLEDNMLTYDKMGFFGKSSHESEQVYDHGYGLVNYIASEYGADALAEIANAMQSIRYWSFDGALKKVTGKSGDELYKGWRASLAARYEAQTASIRDNVRGGSALATDGFMTIAPTFSPDGRKIAFLSNKGSDFAGTSIYLMDRDGKNAKSIKGGVSSPPRFSPDGKTILYSKKVKVDKYGSTVNDLYRYDIESRKEKRLTRKSRFADVDLSPDGEKVVAVSNSDGTHRLMLLDNDGKNAKELWAGENGVQIYHPRFSPDGTEILFGIFLRGTRDIATVSSDGTDFRYLLKTVNDERDAVWGSEGKSVIFSSDRDGIFNIYELNVETRQIQKHSNVIGGAFMPAVSPDGGAIAYTGYNSKGYGVHLLDAQLDPVETMDEYAYENRQAGEFDECEFMRSASAEPSQPAEFLSLAQVDADTPDPASDAALQDLGVETPLETKPYKPAYTSFQFYPRFMIYDGKPRAGIFIASNEILDKQQAFVGGSYGSDSEFDAYLSYEIRNFYPTVYADFIVLSQKENDNGIVDGDPASPTFGHEFDFDLRYDLWAADLGIKLEFAETFSATSQHDLSLFWTHSEYSVNVNVRETDEGGLQLAPSDAGWKYFIGNEATLRYTFRQLARRLDTGVNPRGGRSVNLQYTRAWDKLFTSGEFVYGFRPDFDDNNFGLYSADWREYVGLPWLKHSLRVRLYGAAIDRDVDDFFWIYLGGRDGIRGYTYYSIGGRKGGLASITYRFPILRNLDRQFLHLYFRDVYGSVFYEAANSWSGGSYDFGDNKESAGFELRFSLGSYYIFPTAVSIVAARSLDTIQFIDPRFGGINSNVTTTIERDWFYYFTLGFGFDL